MLSSKSRYKNIAIISILLWTSLIGVNVFFENKTHHENINKLAIQTARAYFERDVSFRMWAASHGGIYVPVDSITQPNPYLSNVSEQNILTDSGQFLTLMNPAYITRQLYNRFTNTDYMVGRITKINPTNPDNAPDEWEQKALNEFKKGLSEKHEFYKKNDNSYIRFMKPLIYKDVCNKCHANTGRNIGDVGGGISITAPLNRFIEPELASLKSSLYSLIIIWVIGCICIILAIYYLSKRNQKQKIAEQKALENEERYKKLADVTFEGIIVHDEGKILDMNQSFENMTQYTLDELKNKNIIELLVSKPYQNYVFERMNVGSTQPFDIELIKKDGTSFYAELESKVLKLSGKTLKITAVRDISTKIQAQTELFSAQQNLKFHIEQTPLGVIEWNANFEVTRWNKAAEKIFGYSFNEIKGKQAELIIPHDEKNNVNKIWNSLLTLKGGVNSINKNITKNGDIITCEWYNTPLYNGNGDVLAVASMVNDISEKVTALKKIKQKNNELKTAEEEIRAAMEELQATNDELKNKMNELRLAENEIIKSNTALKNKNEQLQKNAFELEEAQKKAIESDNLKSKFLANMSHEIRTPMNAIIGFSQLLQSKNLDYQKQNEFINIIVNSGNQLLTIVNDILDISRIETGQLKIQAKNIKLKTLAENLNSVFKLKAKNTNNQLTFNQKSPDITLVSDENRINQVLTNLINNALKFTQNGDVEFGYEKKNDNVVFYVKDTGIGIDKKNLTRIFERFNQEDRIILKEVSGVGLGLSISKGLVNMLGGDIWVNSELGKGSCFYFNIPLKKYIVDESLIEINPDRSYNFKKFKILVAEDNQENFKVLKEMLADTQATLIHAQNGQEAIDIYKQNDDVNLVLMDIRMPVLDGYQTALHLKRINPKLPIIAQTAYALTNDQEELINARFDNCILKPIDAITLLSKISKYATSNS